MSVVLRRYRLNRLLCWHGKKSWQLEMGVNGATIYCGRCGFKKIGVYVFGSTV